MNERKEMLLVNSYSNSFTTIVCNSNIIFWLSLARNLPGFLDQGHALFFQLLALMAYNDTQQLILKALKQVHNVSTIIHTYFTALHRHEPELPSMPLGS